MASATKDRFSQTKFEDVNWARDFRKIDNPSFLTWMQEKLVNLSKSWPGFFVFDGERPFSAEYSKAEDSRLWVRLGTKFTWSCTIADTEITAERKREYEIRDGYVVMQGSPYPGKVGCEVCGGMSEKPYYHLFSPPPDDLVFVVCTACGDVLKKKEPKVCFGSANWRFRKYIYECPYILVPHPNAKLFDTHEMNQQMSLKVDANECTCPTLLWGHHPGCPCM